MSKNPSQNFETPHELEVICADNWENTNKMHTCGSPMQAILIVETNICYLLNLHTEHKTHKITMRKIRILKIVQYDSSYIIVMMH